MPIIMVAARRIMPAIIYDSDICSRGEQYDDTLQCVHGRRVSISAEHVIRNLNGNNDGGGGIRECVYSIIVTE